MKIKEIWFDAEHIYGRDEEGHEYSQSLLWYPKLRTATDEERAAYTFCFDGADRRGLVRIKRQNVLRKRKWSIYKRTKRASCFFVIQTHRAMASSVTL